MLLKSLKVLIRRISVPTSNPKETTCNHLLSCYQEDLNLMRIEKDHCALNPWMWRVAEQY
ncbi:hypothetical protein LEMLEM_LOCUS7097 [Lemmus lemmus]